MASKDRAKKKNWAEKTAGLLKIIKMLGGIKMKIQYLITLIIVAMIYLTIIKNLGWRYAGVNELRMLEVRVAMLERNQNEG